MDSRQQSRFLMDLLDSLTHPFYVVNISDYTISLANAATKIGSLSGNPTCYALTHKNDRPCQGADHVCPLEEVKKTGKPVVAEHIHYSEDGDARNVEVHGYPIIDDEGNIIQMVEYCFDITERKRAEEALRESEERYRELAESITDVFFAFDKDLKYTYWNRASEELTGVSAEDALGKHLYELFPDVESTRKAEAIYRKALRTNKPQHLVNEHQINGKDYVFDITAYPSKDGLSVFVRDITESKRAEQALRDSENKYKHLFDGLNDAAFLADVETGIILDTNKQGEVLLGCPRQEIIGMHQTELHPPGKTEEYRRRFAAHVKRGHRADYDGEAIRKDGHIIPVNISASPVTIGGEHLIFGLFRDITERKQAEDRLREAEQNFRNSLDDSPLGVRIVTAEGELLYANRAILDIYGYRNFKELKTTPTKQRYTPESYVEHKERAKNRKLGKPVPASYQIGIVRKDGEVRNLQVFRREVTWNGELQYQTLYEDITERKRATDALRDSEEKLSRIFESVTDAIVVTDLNGVITDVNEAALRISGFNSKSDLIGKNTFETIASHDRKRALSNMQELIASGTTSMAEYSLLKADGSEYPAEISAGVFRDKDGSPMGFISVIRDITESKRLEKEVAEYEELSKLKSNLLSSVSHELRTPLAVIKGYSTMLTRYDKKLSSNEKSGTLKSIDKATDRLTELVDNLLDMSRLEAGLLDLQKRPTYISELLKQSVHDARIAAPGRNITLEIRKRLPRLNIDPRRIGEVLDNLIQNAINYSEEGTTVTVQARRKKAELLVSVVDQGVGIPAEELPKVFDRMYRIEQRVTQETGGAGLGLAICKGLIEKHGGRIWVESEVGRGSTFYFSLPLDTEEE